MYITRVLFIFISKASRMINRISSIRRASRFYNLRTHVPVGPDYNWTYNLTVSRYALASAAQSVATCGTKLRASEEKELKKEMMS
jgi:hypothetical protein